jgi:cytochrome c peroxidase
MKFVTSAFLLLFVLGAENGAISKPLSELLKDAAIKNGLLNPTDLNEKFNPKLAAIGETIFNSKSFSINGNISCQSCHLDKFGGADGIPNAIGVGGEGEGKDRILRGGSVVPRNTLPLWGRGWSKFETFFWDGKIDFSNGKRVSQFGTKAPSDDPLLIAIHLPVVEIREMLAEDKFVARNKQEKVSAAEAVYVAVVKNIVSAHPKKIEQLAMIRNKSVSNIEFLDLAIAVKDFIRKKFAVKPYKFSRFVFDGGHLEDREIRGALLFYGKAKCSVCHGGPLLSDLDFHVIPSYQLGAGKNGFGVDYGRFNVTHNPTDLYKFRTPPLLNVSKTGPYGHSGAFPTMQHVITSHFDPLGNVETKNLDAVARSEMYKKISRASEVFSLVPPLKSHEVNALVDFLRTLEF